jgi:integrase/recombinase XerD
MTWEIWIDIFITRYCYSKGLRSLSIVSYKEVLKQFYGFTQVKLQNKPPNEITTQDLCEYIEHLRTARSLGNASVNKTVVVLRSFYKCAVSFDLMSPSNDPTRFLPKMKGVFEVAGDILNAEEMNRLANTPDPRTVVGIRDRVVLLLLCTTGIRASECEGIKIKDVDLDRKQIRIKGKGGHERRVNLNNETTIAIKNYLSCRKNFTKDQHLFLVRTENRLTRWRIYERIRFYLKKARIFKKISPHRLRHSFATHMLKVGTNIVVLKELLGHRSLTSTMRYVRISGEQLREAIDKLKVDTLFEKILEKFPQAKVDCFIGKIEENINI